MSILDENISVSQRQLLRGGHIAVRHRGHDIGEPGMKDQEFIPFLHRLRHPTFFTRDLGFNARHLAHAGCCLVYLAVAKDEVAIFVRRLLRHQDFATQTKRMGTAIRVSHAGLSVWRLHAEKEMHFAWDR